MLIPEDKNKICIFCDAQDSYYIDTFNNLSSSEQKQLKQWWYLENFLQIEEENKRLKKQLELFNLSGNTVDKTSYNESINKNVVLKAQIEKMKCCGNCKYNDIYEGEEFCNNEKGVCKYYSKTFKEDIWELIDNWELID